MSHQIEAAVAEGGHRMKEPIPDAPCKSEIPDKNRCQKSGARKLQKQRGLQNKTGQTDNPAYLSRRNRLLHGAALPETDPFSGEQENRERSGDNSHASDLKKKHKNHLAEQRPVGNRVLYHQAGHAGRRSNREQSVRKGSPLPVSGRDRKHQKKRPDQNDAKKSEKNDL